MDTFIFKSLNGMDYIGKLKEEDGEYYKIQEMYAIFLHQDNQGSERITLGAPIHPAVGKIDKKLNNGAIDVDMPKSAVVFKCIPDERLIELYMESVRGIQIITTLPGKM